MPEEWLRRLGTLPLGHQPGHGWLYNHGSDLAGIVISRVTGQPLSHFLRERIFTPLGMQDTAFFVPPEKLSRFGPEYRETGGSSLIVDDPTDGHFSRPPIFEQRSGGLVTTADDLLTFQRFLLDGGRAGSQRTLVSRLGEFAADKPALSCPRAATGAGSRLDVWVQRRPASDRSRQLDRTLRLDRWQRHRSLCGPACQARSTSC